MKQIDIFHFFIRRSDVAEQHRAVPQDKKNKTSIHGDSFKDLPDEALSGRRRQIALRTAT